MRYLPLLTVLPALALGAAQQAPKADSTPIDTSRITESEPPALPQAMILPQPPVHAITTDASSVPIDADTFTRAHGALYRGLAALKAMQHESGGWLVDTQVTATDSDTPSPVSVAVTALAIKAFIQHDPQSIEQEHIRSAIRYILRARQNDGSFEGGTLTNYVTSAVVSALAALPDNDDTLPLRNDLASAVDWLQTAQWDQSEGLNERQDWYGGAGYGKHGRPDLSNTQMMLEALYDAGLSPDEPAFQRAQNFLARTQNLSATNPSPWAGDDGGFVYTPANGGESMASQAAGEGRYGENMPAGVARSLRSYGSMTYAGFKSMIYAGLSPDDVRVRAAFDWIRRHWTFDENPGMGQQGLYYYYAAMSRALNIAQQHEITDHAGTTHNWRAELIDALAQRQRDDGTWKNESDRWMEGLPEMATIHAALALEETLKPVLSRSTGDAASE